MEGTGVNMVPILTPHKKNFRLGKLYTGQCQSFCKCMDKKLFRNSVYKTYIRVYIASKEALDLLEKVQRQAGKIVSEAREESHRENTASTDLQASGGRVARRRRIIT